MQDIRKCLELAKKTQGIRILHTQGNDITLYDDSFLTRTGYEDPYVLYAYPGVKTQAQTIINHIANMPDEHITQDIMYVIDLENTKTQTSLMKTINTVINAIGTDANLDINDVLSKYELERQQTVANRMEMDYSVSSGSVSVSSGDVSVPSGGVSNESDIIEIAQESERIVNQTVETEESSITTKTVIQYKGYPALTKPNPKTDKQVFRTKIKVDSEQSQDEAAVKHLYDIGLTFGSYQEETATDILNRIDLFTQTLLTGESCCIIKYILFWYFHNKDFKGKQNVKIDSKTGLPDFAFHNERFMRTVNSEVNKAVQSYQQMVAQIEQSMKKFYSEFYKPVVIDGAKSLDWFFDTIYNVSNLQSFFQNNLMDQFKNPANLGSAILGVLEGIVQAILAAQIQQLIQIAVYQQDLLKQHILDSLAQSMKSRMYYFAVIKSNFLYYYGNENVKVKDLHDIFEQKYLPNVSGSESGYVNCGTIVNFTSQFLDIMSYAPIIEVIDQLLSTLIVLLFKFMYSLLEEQYNKVALEGLWQNLQWRKVSGMEAQQKQLWKTIENILNLLKTDKTAEQLKACILNRGKQVESADEAFLVRRINKIFDAQILEDVLDKLDEVPILKEVTERIRALLEFLQL